MAGFYTPDYGSLPYSLGELPLFLLLGAASGALAVAFTRGFERVVALRRAHEGHLLAPAGGAVLILILNGCARVH